MITFEILVLDEHGDKISVHLFVVFVTVVVFGVITGIVACYISIWISVRRRKRRKLSAPNKQDKALALTILLAAGTFVVTWVIPMLYISISRTCKSCHQLSVQMLMWLRLLFTVQSVLNPIIYCYRLSEFKERLKAGVQKIKCFKDSEQQPTVGSTSARRIEANNSVRAL